MKGSTRAQVRYQLYERVSMRALFAVVVALHMPAGLPSDRLAAPNGLARLVDLSFLLEPSVFSASQYLLWAALILYVLRIAWSLVLPYITLLSIAVGSVQNSQGAIGHHLQIVSLVLLAQTAAHFYSRFRRPDEGATTDGGNEDRLIHWSQQAIAATYLVSGLTKLINTGGMWFFQSPLVAVQIIKTADQNYYNTLNPAAYGSTLALAEWMVRHPLLVGMAMSGGLLLELSAPLLLRGRGWAALFGLALLAFHETISRVMNLSFTYNKYLILIFLVNVPFWALLAFRAIRRHPT